VIDDLLKHPACKHGRQHGQCADCALVAAYMRCFKKGPAGDQWSTSASVTLHEQIADTVKQELASAFAEGRASSLQQVPALLRKPAGWGYDLAAGLTARLAYRAINSVLDRLGQVTVDQLLALIVAKKSGSLPREGP
jgi:hypothetical protein